MHTSTIRARRPLLSYSSSSSQTQKCRHLALVSQTFVPFSRFFGGCRQGRARWWWLFSSCDDREEEHFSPSNTKPTTIQRPTPSPPHHLPSKLSTTDITYRPLAPRVSTRNKCSQSVKSDNTEPVASFIKHRPSFARGVPSKSPAYEREGAHVMNHRFESHQ